MWVIRSPATSNANTLTVQLDGDTATGRTYLSEVARLRMAARN
jgi:hypothetical protein